MNASESTTTSPAPAQVTTTVSQPHDTPSQKGVLGLDNTSVFLSFIIGGIVLISTVVGIWKNISGTLRQNKKDQIDAANDRSKDILDKMDGHYKTMGERVTSLEAVAKDFMPKGQITSMIENERAGRLKDREHDRDNQKQASQFAADTFKEHGKLITDLRLGQEAQRRDHENLAGDVKEIKNLIKDSLNETKELIKDKIQDLKSHVQEQGEATNKRINDLAETEADHFNQMCTSIRESTKRSVKPD